MPNDDGYDEYEAQVDDGSGDGNPDIRNLRAKAKRAEDAEAENERLKQQLVFFQAGIDTTTPLGEMFAAGYRGDLTVDAVTAKAIEVGALTAPEAAPEGPALTPEEQISTEERQSLSQDAEPLSGEAPKKSGKVQAMEVAIAARESGASREQTLGSYFSQVAQAAEAGDTSVLVQQPQ